MQHFCCCQIVFHLRSLCQKQIMTNFIGMAAAILLPASLCQVVDSAMQHKVGMHRQVSRQVRRSTQQVDEWSETMGDCDNMTLFFNFLCQKVAYYIPISAHPTLKIFCIPFKLACYLITPLNSEWSVMEVQLTATFKLPHPHTKAYYRLCTHFW